MEREDVLYWLQEHKRSVLVGLAAVAMIGGLFWRHDSNATKPPDKVQVMKEEASPKTATLLKEYQPSTKLRDPFKLEEKKTIEPGAPSEKPLELKKTGAAEKAAPVFPVLCGVACGGGRQAAIISLGGESKVLQVGEQIGAYRLLELSEHEAHLEKDGQVIILQKKGDGV